MDTQAANQATAEKAVADNAATLNPGNPTTAISSSATPVIQTTTANRATTASNITSFNNANVNKANVDAVTKQNQATEDANNADTTTKTGSGSDTTGTSDTGDDIASTFKDSIDTIKASGQAQVDSANASLKSALGLNNSSYDSTINQLTDMYNDRIAGVNDEYDRLGAKKQTSALRSGLARYAPDQAAGVLTDNEVQGHQAVNNLLVKLQDATQQAQTAKNNNDTRSFNTAYKNIQDTNKQMGDAITSLYKQAVDYKNADLKQKADAQKQAQAQITNNLDTSKKAASFILNDADYKDLSAADKEKFIESYAKSINVDPEFLKEAVSSAAATASTKKGSQPYDVSQYEEGDYIPGHGFLMPDGTVTDEKYTPAQEKLVTNANITGKDSATYFLNTPAAFQKEYIQSHVGSSDKTDLTAVNTAYKAWVADQKKTTTKATVPNPFAEADTTPVTK